MSDHGAEVAPGLIRAGYDPDPSRSLSLRKEAYVDPVWFRRDMQAILGRSWQS